jgi:hypothetical protein
MVAAAHVNDVLAVSADRDTGQLLTVISVVVCKAVGLEVRSLGDPDVAQAAFVEGPGDARTGGGGCELVWERVALNLFDGE